MSSHNTSGTGLTGRGLTLPTVSAMEASDGTAVLADGHGDETARYAGIVAAAIGCFCLVLRARIGSCLGARPVIMSVAVPVETSTWGSALGKLVATCRGKCGLVKVEQTDQQRVLQASRQRGARCGDRSCMGSMDRIPE